MQSDKNVLLPTMMSAMLLLPAINNIINIGKLYILFPSSIFILYLIAYKGKVNLQYFGRRTWIYIVVFILSVISIAFKSEQYEYDDYIVVISGVLLCFGLKMQNNWKRWYFDYLLYSGGFVLVLYFVNTAVAHDMIPLWNRGTSDIWYINMVALLVMMISAGQYIYCDDKIMQIVYIVCAVLATVVMAINESTGAMIIVLVMMLVYAIAIVPIAKIMQKLFQIFFIFSFLICNMSLLVNYTSIVQVDNLVYHLESSIVGEIILFTFGLLIIRHWDRIPQEADLKKVRMIKLQIRLQVILKVVCCMIVICLALARVDGTIGIDQLIQKFIGDKWGQINTDVFIVACMSFIKKLNQALIQAWHGNILAVMHQMYGVVGVIVIIAVLAVACYKLYLTIRDRRIKDSLLTWLAIGVLAAVICLPIMVEALPVYMMILLLALYTAKPEYGEPQVIETQKTEEREEESVEKEEMMEGVFII